MSSGGADGPHELCECCGKRWVDWRVMGQALCSLCYGALASWLVAAGLKKKRAERKERDRLQGQRDAADAIKRRRYAKRVDRDRL
jgi:hypothetical protein